MPRTTFTSGRNLLLLLALSAVIAGAWWWQRPPPEPMYQGQRISECQEWLIGDENLHTNEFTPEKLHAFGPGVVQWLAYTAEHGKRGFRKQGPLPFDNSPDWLRRFLPEKWGGLRASSHLDEVLRALSALQLLGSEAAPVIPILARILERESQGGNYAVAYFASVALQSIGPASRPIVEQTLEHGNPNARGVLLLNISYRLGTVAQPAADSEVANAFATLIKGCDDLNDVVRENATWGLGRYLKTRPDLIVLDSTVQKLVNLLYDSHPQVRFASAQALGFCGAKAVPAIPRLIELLDDRTVSVREYTAQTLAKVDISEKRSAVRLRTMLQDEPDSECREFVKTALRDLGLALDEGSASPKAVPSQ